MPELCRFFGIIVRMQCGDHPPPHFHAVYGDARASIDIEGLVVNRICGDACGCTAGSETGEIREISRFFGIDPLE